MQPLPADDLYLVEGVVSDLIPLEGVTQLQIDDQWFRVMNAHVTKPVTRGESVRLLVQDSTTQPILDVLVIERPDDGKVEYTGPSASLALTVIAAALLAFALDDEILWLALPACALGLLQMKFSMQKDRMIRRYKALCRQASSVSRATASPAPPPADVPLTLPTPALARPEDSSAWPSQILEFTHDAIIIWELDGGGILYWNRAAEQLYGYSRQEAYGQVTHDLLKTQLDGTTADLETALTRYGIWAGDLRHTRRDGQSVEVEARLALMAQDRRPRLVLEVNRDVTDRNRAAAEREDATQQLERARREP